jgi:hypothetical protein
MDHLFNAIMTAGQSLGLDGGMLNNFPSMPSAGSMAKPHAGPIGVRLSAYGDFIPAGQEVRKQLVDREPTFTMLVGATHYGMEPSN